MSVFRQHKFAVAAIGTTRIVSETFEVVSIQVDNPSLLWLFIPEAYAYIRPQTLGWVGNIQPPRNTINIQYVTEPSGGTPSTASGNDITITTFPVAQRAFDGTNYALATISDIAALETRLDSLIANSNSLNTLTAIATNVPAAPATFALNVPPNTTNYFFLIFNNSTATTLYVGPNAAVNAANGMPISPSNFVTINVGEGSNISLYLTGGGGVVDTRILYGQFG